MKQFKISTKLVGIDPVFFKFCYYSYKKILFSSRKLDPFSGASVLQAKLDRWPCVNLPCSDVPIFQMLSDI